MTTPAVPIPAAPIPAPEPSRRAMRLAAASGWYASVAGLLSFMGWILDVRRLTAWGGTISIQANATLAATAAGAGLVLLAHGRRRAVAPFGALAGLIGVATLFEHASGVDLGIDALLTFGRPWTGTATVAPGRMGPPASICWTLLGLGMLLALRGRQARQGAAALGLATMVLGSLSFIGYLFGANPLYAIAPLTAIALQTATMVLAAGASLVAALPDSQPMRTLTERSAAGLLARRSLPFVIVVPVALGLLAIQGRRAEWFDRGLGYSLLVLAFIIAMIAVLWWCVGAVRDHERALADANRTVQENEARLRQAGKMEAIGRLAGGVAHDFNNQLSAVMGFATFAARDRGMSEQARGDLQEVIKATERMAGVTRQLLAFSRQQVLQPETLQLNTAVLDGCALLQRLIGTDIEMRLNLTADPTWVRVDRAQLLQVLMNLAINARDAMPKGGNLGIRTDRVEEPEPPGAHVLLTVSDNGAGIRAEHLPHIFEPFFTTKEQGQGTGLGLATVHGIVTQSRGQIRVESRAGEGSEFTVLFPAVAAPPEEPAVVAQGGQPGDGGPPAPDKSPAPSDREGPVTPPAARLLVVDDEDALRWMVSRMLQEEGYEVLQARNGREALERLARKDRVDLVLTDVVMPVLGGRELVERITVDYPGLPVIWMSGHPHDTAFADAGPGGGPASAHPFLQKPTPADVLARTVAGVLARETAAPQSM
jgi:signal transduction histidine kinase/ActR/RegA family two-component response regulator